MLQTLASEDGLVSQQTRCMHTKVHDRDGPQLLTSLRRFNLACDVVPLVAFFDLKGIEQ
jgi:hypothetical protein